MPRVLGRPSSLFSHTDSSTLAHEEDGLMADGSPGIDAGADPEFWGEAPERLLA